MSKTPEQLVLDIQDACKELGWHIGMDESESGVRGLVIGDFDYVNEIVEQLNEVDNYSIYSNGEEAETDLH